MLSRRRPRLHEAQGLEDESGAAVGEERRPREVAEGGQRWPERLRDDFLLAEDGVDAQRRHVLAAADEDDGARARLDDVALVAERARQIEERHELGAVAQERSAVGERDRAGLEVERLLDA